MVGYRVGTGPFPFVETVVASGVIRMGVLPGNHSTVVVAAFHGSSWQMEIRPIESSQQPLVGTDMVRTLSDCLGRRRMTGHTSSEERRLTRKELFHVSKCHQ